MVAACQIERVAERHWQTPKQISAGQASVGLETALKERDRHEWAWNLVPHLSKAQLENGHGLLPALGAPSLSGDMHVQTGTPVSTRERNRHLNR